MAINFNFGEHFHYDSGGFLIKLITSILGAFFGFLFALLLNNLLERKNKNNTIKQTHRQHYNQLKYLSVFLESTAINSERQFKEIENHSKLVLASPLKISEPAWFASNDLERLNNMSSGELFQSYLSFFSETDEEIKNYKNIFSNIDYLNRVFQDFSKRVEKHQNYMSNHFKTIVDCIENIVLIIGNFENYLISSNSSGYQETPEYKYLLYYKQFYIDSISKEPDFMEYKTHFFIPFQTTIFNNIHDLVFVETIIPHIRKGSNTLLTAELNSVKYAEACVDDSEDVQKSITYIKNISDKIKKLNAP